MTLEWSEHQHLLAFARNAVVVHVVARQAVASLTINCLSCSPSPPLAIEAYVARSVPQGRTAAGPVFHEGLKRAWLKYHASTTLKWSNFQVRACLMKTK